MVCEKEEDELRIMLFDTHAHFDDERFDGDRHITIMKAYESGVSRILNASSDIKSCEASISLAQQYSFVYAAIGIHPHYAADFDEKTEERLANLAANPRVVAIGEIGLDYYYENSPRNMQQICFIKQVNLAKSLNMPIIVHNRDAHEDVMEIIKRENAKQVGGVFHCYSGSVEMARELIKNNFYISIGGAVTFKNARRLVDVVKFLPLDRILIETDCPYLTPEPFRGKRNDSSYVRLVAQKIAEIKGLDFEEIARTTMHNANTLFKLG